MIRTEQVNAEYAVAVTGDNFAEMFASMDDDYMKARSADIKDNFRASCPQLKWSGRCGLKLD